MTTALTTTARDPLAQLLSDPDQFSAKMQIYGALAVAKAIPPHFRSPADLLMAHVMSESMGVPMIEVVQNMVLINGSPAWRTDYLIDRINASGLFSTPLDWKVTGTGDAMEAQCFATRRDGVVVSERVTMAEAIADGWTKNAKYRSMPETMLRYRAATKFWRFRAKGALRGPDMSDVEVETIAVVEAPPVATPAPAIPQTGMALLQQMAANEPEPAPKPKKDPLKEPLLKQIRAAYKANQATIDATVAAMGGKVSEMADLSVDQLSEVIRAYTPAPASNGLDDANRERLAGLISDPAWPIDGTAALCDHLGITAPIDVARLTDSQVKHALDFVDGQS